ncbi:MAG: cell surface protein, partial [bacterium]|nr:cell surface protein [bacterium]
VEIDATPKTPIYNNDDTNNLEFSVGTGTTFTSYKLIKNRYALSENNVTVPIDQMWNTGVWNTTAPTTVNDPADDRRGLPFYPVEVGKTFSVKLDATIADKVYAYYVVLDEDYALESAPSEWNAWDAYNIDGLEQVYMADETAALKITSTSAIGDFIGFRVVVVNQDGTLVDPDGKSFYVTVGAQSSSWNAVNTVVTALNPNELLPILTKSAEVNVTLSAVTGANTFTWTTDEAEDGTEPAFDVFFADANDVVLFGTDGTGAVTANFANVKKVYTVATVNDWLEYTDNKVYSGTLTINNANGNVLRTLNVSFKKVLPTGAPEGFSVKTNQIATDGVYYSYLVPNDWTAPLAIQGTMPLNQVFNFGTGLLANYQTTFAASAMSGTNLVSTVVTGANTLSVAKEFVDNTTQHATTVAYNYGLISTATPTVDYKVTILGFPTVFSNIYNHTYSWRWATRADLGLAATAALPYSTSIEYGDTQSFDLAHVFGVSTRDSQYNAFLDNPYLASLQVISAKLVSNANGLDEYFDVTPDPLAGATVFTLTQKSGSTNPTADVASTLVLTAKDMYDNDVEIELPMTVTKR